MKKVLLFALCLMLMVLPLEVNAQSDRETQPPSPKISNLRILILHSYHEGFTWTDNVTKGIRSVFTEEAPDVELLFEFMDVKRLYTDEYLHQLREFYRFKYAGRKIDAIISSDDHALEFLLGVGQDFFPNVPVVFCAVNGYDPARHRSNGRQLTGVVESIDIKATLEIALKLHPKTKEVAVITDQTITGRALKASAEKIFRNYEDRVRFTYLEHLTMEQLWQEVSALPRESIVFAFIFTRDQFGRIWSHEYNLERLATHCKVPIYSVWEFYLGHGITGGMLTSGQMHGEMAARMALRVLRGENASEIPVVLESPNRYMFDDNQLRRFGVKSSSLPKNSIIVNRPFSVYKEYKSLIWGVIAVIVLLLIIVAILVEDIMLRRRTEKALRESEHRHKMVSELISDYIFRLTVNDDGKIVMDLVTENFSTITGRTVEDVQTPDMWAEVIHPDDLEKVMKLLETTVSSGQSGELECRSFVKGGQERWIHIFARPQWDEEKQRTTAIFGAVKDITKRKRTEDEIRKLNAELEQRVKQRTAELEAANQELKDFAYVVSHDLKAPLRGISQLGQWLVQDYGDAFDEEGEKMIDLLINRVKRMDGLIDGILEYSRIGRIVGKNVEINLNRLVKEVIDSIAPPDYIQILIESDLPVIVGDKTRITEVFQNLIENAFKFMDKPEGKISIDCADEGSCWAFRVVDNGPGIDPKYHEKIFQIFQTLEPRDVHESTGVGLALVKKIIEFYGGKIWVESTTGKGSTFSFRLPKKGVKHDEQ
jgi:PAS domain S-box-containing protein